MKVLAIRGRNLASLAGHFDIDLEQGQLRNAGLYAITGPVGAGKSTLLDALCLALYDRTPRLGHGGVRIGRAGDDDDKRLRLVVIKFCGLMGFSLAAIHAVLALSIWTPAYFAKYFDDAGRLCD